ncbi:hypothetical protein C8J57DRAFT_1315442 [Mycena rebaudengoi]|nr:hypothetical protein C8J57DRAFT_1315442 [Mycena rebaudengoi]
MPRTMAEIKTKPGTPQRRGRMGGHASARAGRGCASAAALAANPRAPAPARGHCGDMIPPPAKPDRQHRYRARDGGRLRGHWKRGRRCMQPRHRTQQHQKTNATSKSGTHFINPNHRITIEDRYEQVKRHPVAIDQRALARGGDRTALSCNCTVAEVCFGLRRWRLAVPTMLSFVVSMSSRRRISSGISCPWKG